MSCVVKLPIQSASNATRNVGKPYKTILKPEKGKIIILYVNFISGFYIGLVTPHAVTVCLRGDTDFSLTDNFNRWAEPACAMHADREVDFILGMDARGCLIKRAEELTAEEWRVLERKPKYEIKTQERRKPESVKERIVIEREYKNIRLESEHVGEFEYQPGKCKQRYRIVVVRKNLSVERGERVLFDDIRHFFLENNFYR